MNEEAPDSAGEGADRPAIRIGELARRVGVRPETLRAWERRYGLLSPRRTPSGYRLYSSADEARVRAMLAWIARGVSASEAATLAREREMPVASLERGAAEADAPALADAAAALIEALQAFDDEAAHLILDRALGRFSLPTVLAELVLPVLAEVGDRWARGEVSVGEEHFSTELVRGRLLALARGWGSGEGPRALLACPPGERHDLGLVVFGLALREHGWRIAFLGADTPLTTLAEAAERLDPDIVVVSAVEAGRFEDARRELRELAARQPVAVAGAGASSETARSLGALHLDTTPVDAARELVGSARTLGDRP